MLKLFMQKNMDILKLIDDFMNSKLVSQIVGSIIILILGLIAIKIVERVLRKGLKRSKLDGVLHTFIINTAKVILYIVLLVTVLGQLGVKTTTFITMLGACGAAIALALKDSLSNFAGGILIIVNKPFVKGDLIDACGVSGKVEKIDLLYSTLITGDNKVISIPNGSLAADVVVNYSEANLRRIDCKFGIGYDADIAQAKSIIASIIEKSPLLLSDPEPVIGVTNHGDNAVELDVFVWCKTDDYHPARYGLYEDVKNAFDANGVSIPYPQVVVHFEGKQNETTEA